MPDTLHNMGDQRDKILEAEKALDCGPVDLARKLNTPYDTLKSWKNERVVMPGVAYVAIKLLLKNNNR